MSDSARVTPEVAEVLARWAGLTETLSPQQMAEIFENVRGVIDRLYAVDVEDFEADFLQPSSRAR